MKFNFAIKKKQINQIGFFFQQSYKSTSWSRSSLSCWPPCCWRGHYHFGRDKKSINNNWLLAASRTGNAHSWFARYFWYDFSTFSSSLALTYLIVLFIRVKHGEWPAAKRICYHVLAFRVAYRMNVMLKCGIFEGDVQNVNNACHSDFDYVSEHKQEEQHTILSPGGIFYVWNVNI